MNKETCEECYKCYYYWFNNDTENECFGNCIACIDFKPKNTLSKKGVNKKRCLWHR